MFTNEKDIAMCRDEAVLASLAAQHPNFFRITDKKIQNKTEKTEKVENHLEILAKRYHDYYLKLQTEQLSYSLQLITAKTTHTPYQYSGLLYYEINDMEQHAGWQYRDVMKRLRNNIAEGKYSFNKLK